MAGTGVGTIVAYSLPTRPRPRARASVLSTWCLSWGIIARHSEVWGDKLIPMTFRRKNTNLP